MSLGIVWRPSKEADSRLEIGAPSAFIDMMGEVGFRIPCTIDTDDRPVLYAMSIVWRRIYDKDTPNPFAQLVDLIDGYESIDLNTVA